MGRVREEVREKAEKMRQEVEGMRREMRDGM